MKFLFCLLGMVLIVEGLPYFAFPERMKKWMAAIQAAPDSYLRTLGLLAMTLGLLLVYFFIILGVTYFLSRQRGEISF